MTRCNCGKWHHGEKCDDCWMREQMKCAPSWFMFLCHLVAPLFPIALAIELPAGFTWYR
jgi:uncharacterized protein involved in cysteine biosynthesis